MLTPPSELDARSDVDRLLSGRWKGPLNPTPSGRGPSPQVPLAGPDGRGRPLALDVGVAGRVEAPLHVPVQPAGRDAEPLVLDGDAPRAQAVALPSLVVTALVHCVAGAA